MVATNGVKPAERTAWYLGSDDVLSVLLQGNKDEWDYAVYERGLTAWMLPPRGREPHQALFDALWECYREGLPIHDTVVLEKARGAVSLEQFHQLFALYDPLRGSRDVFAANLDLVVEKGTAAANLRLLIDAEADLRAGKPQAEVIDQLIAVLGSATPDKTKEVTSDKALARFIEYMNAPESPLIRSGINWWDIHTGGGMRPGFMYWIAAAYKSRKSSIARNIKLGALANQATVTFGSFEGDQKRIVAELIVMLAVLYMLEHGTFHKTYQRGGNTFEMHQISAATLTAARKYYRRDWPKEQVEAIDYAIETFRGFKERLTIYDSTRRAGRLTDMRSVARMIASDKAMYDTDLVVLDYLQRIKGKSARESIYERVSENSFELQDLALSQQVAIIVLTQLNEETIKGNQGGDGWASGSKGGGDAAATADYWITSRYMLDDNGAMNSDDSHVVLTMKFSRHGAMGPATKRPLPIHAWTGLLIPPEYEQQFYGNGND